MSEHRRNSFWKVSITTLSVSNDCRVRREITICSPVFDCFQAKSIAVTKAEKLVGLFLQLYLNIVFID